jgi:hypothetical protein
MLPLPPVRFSTVTGWPHRVCRWLAMMRADRSTPPPAATETTMRIGLFGYLASGCATAGAVSARINPATRSALLILDITHSLRPSFGFLDLILLRQRNPIKPRALHAGETRPDFQTTTTRTTMEDAP